VAEGQKEGKKQPKIPASETQKAEQINWAEGEGKGEARAILLRVEAAAVGIERVANAISGTRGGPDAVSLSVAEKYVEAFGRLAKESTAVVVVVVVAASTSEVGSMVAQVSHLCITAACITAVLRGATLRARPQQSSSLLAGSRQRAKSAQESEETAER